MMSLAVEMLDEPGDSRPEQIPDTEK